MLLFVVIQCAIDASVNQSIIVQSVNLPIVLPPVATTPLENTSRMVINMQCSHQIYHAPLVHTSTRCTIMDMCRTSSAIVLGEEEVILAIVPETHTHTYKQNDNPL